MFMPFKRQAGGTLLGFIAGLVVGLAIAVVVAITINKTPVPFMEKAGGKPPAATTGASPNDDPNRPMYGNQNAAREAAKELANQATPSAAPQETPAADAAQAKAPQPKGAETAGAETPQADKWIYYLQAGAFRNQADAESAKARLALQGFEANVMERPSDSGTLYRVRIGPFDQVDAMNRVRSKLTENGMDVAVIRVAR